MKTTDQILIIDLEATCWEADGNYQKQHSEIIEIGACILNRKTGMVTQNKGILVKPRYSEVSEFCTRLTSITSEMLDKHGISLADACEQLMDDFGSEDYTWASYGAYDKNMLKEQCKRFGILYPMSDHHLNVKVLFSEQQGLRKGIGMAGALKMLNKPLLGTHHRGVDDAKNIAIILNELLK